MKHELPSQQHMIDVIGLQLRTIHMLKIYVDIKEELQTYLNPNKVCTYINEADPHSN